jgi:branched-chain amino acid transport system substrate-binding protein
VSHDRHGPIVGITECAQGRNYMTIRNTLAVSALALSVGLLSTPTAWAQTSVKLGVLADMSGIFADIGGMGSYDATKMAVEDFNKLPGADKFKVEVIQGDPQNKPDIARNVARKWFETEDVDALVDIPTSATSLAVAPLTQELNKVALFTEFRALDLRHLGAVPRHRRCNDQGWRQELVLPDGRFCAWQLA